MLLNQQLKSEKSTCSYQRKLNQSWINSKKNAKIMLVTPSSGMFLCCKNLAWNTWVNGQVYFTNLNVLIGCYCRKQPSGKMLNRVWNICTRKMFQLMKLICLTNTTAYATSLKHSLEQMHCHIAKWWRMKDGQPILTRAVLLNCLASS